MLQKDREARPDLKDMNLDAWLYFYEVALVIRVDKSRSIVG